jgi:hypothetical protein
MATYISSNANRFYAAIEENYGLAAPITSANRYPAIRLQAQQILERGKRLDKTGTRTLLGMPKQARRHTGFETRTYLSSWNGSGEPGYGVLFQSAMGGAGQQSSKLQVAVVNGPVQLQTRTPHSLSVGSAISFLNEVRFVTGVPDPLSVAFNAPFTSPPSSGATLAPTVTYMLSTTLPSVTLYDYWDPVTTVSRVVTGAAVNSLSISINGDYHEFAFSGPASDLLDSSSFQTGTGGLSTFPTEPGAAAFDYSVVPGHLGQVWLGSEASQFFTLTEASIELRNNLDVRNREFGSSIPRAVVPGTRQVGSSFTVLAQDDAQTAGLYRAAKQRSTISAMLQLGQQQGQLMGIFLPTVTPEIPNYNDSEARLQWEFRNNMAQGVHNDEIYIAFA